MLKRAFVRMHDVDADEDIYIYVDHISAIAPCDDNSCYVYVDNGMMWRVLGEYDAVMFAIGNPLVMIKR